MASCSSRLSWDGILCELCRQCFDSVFARGRNDLLGSSHSLWHDVPTLRCCARQQCQFCALVLSNYSEIEGSPNGVGLGMIEDSRSPLQFASCSEKHKSWPEIITVQPLPCPSPLLFSSLNIKILEHLDLLAYYTNHLSKLSSDNTSSTETFNKIRAWLLRCQTHSSCQEWSNLIEGATTIPSRLLELKPGKIPKIRLRLKNKHIVNSCEYAALSYCWGGTLAIKLLQSNLLAFCTDIPWGSLTRTFQDAVDVALRLEITYIWIDALCIIQDSAEDWNREAATMAFVYMKSQVTISADASRNGDEGLYRQRDPAVHASFIVPESRSDDGLGVHCRIDRMGRELEYIHDAPLRSRAWVVQERFLSPRTIHFCKGQVYWECIDILTSENVPICVDLQSRTQATRKSLLSYDLAPNALDQSSADGVDSGPQATSNTVDQIEQRYQLWSNLRSTYLRADLSFFSDKPVAIAGLARLFCPLLGLQAKDYIAGVWRPQLIQDLMWHRHGLGRRAPLYELQPDETLPSWSWLFYDSNVVWSGEMERKRDWIYLPTLLKAVSNPHNGNAFGPVLSAFLKISGPLCQIMLSQPATGRWRWKKPSPFERASSICIHFGNASLKINEGFALYLDDKSSWDKLEKNSKMTAYMLLGSGERSETSGSLYGIHDYQCLLLMPAHKRGSFRRIGLVRFTSTHINRGENIRQDVVYALDNLFQSHSVPEHLYESVDEDFMYTINLE